MTRSGHWEILNIASTAWLQGCELDRYEKSLGEPGEGPGQCFAGWSLSVAESREVGLNLHSVKDVLQPCQASAVAQKCRLRRTVHSLELVSADCSLIHLQGSKGVVSKSVGTQPSFCPDFCSLQGDKQMTARVGKPSLVCLF